VAPSANCNQLAEAKALRPWAADQELPIIGIGDYNLDFNFPARRGNRAFDEFHVDYVWYWVEPNRSRRYPHEYQNLVTRETRRITTYISE